jgi:D-xylose reductase
VGYAEVCFLFFPLVVVVLTVCLGALPSSPSRTTLLDWRNLDVLGFDMTQDELQSISALDKGLRFNDPGFYLPNHPLRIF